MIAPAFTRQTFTTSRELEYFSESEFVTQTGHAKKDWWPRVLVKELVDNALDACEQHGVVPEIWITFTGSFQGIPANVVTRILDYSTRTSDKQAYVSPTRGAQGNALKTCLAMPFVLSGSTASTIEIEAQGVKHVITVSMDHIARRPVIDHQQEFVKTAGTTVRLQACLKPVTGPQSLQDEDEEEEEEPGLQALIRDYALFNPHATFVLVENGTEVRFEATAPDWKKWSPTDPTCAHWYDVDRLENLIASHIAAERSGGPQKTVREFVSEFRGLSATTKQKNVSTEAGLERAHLHDLVIGKKLDKAAIGRLLLAMQGASKPVKPEALGILGEAHFRARLVKNSDLETDQQASLNEDDEGDSLQNDGEGVAAPCPTDARNTFTYRRYSEIDEQGLPCTAEVAFCLTDDPGLRGVHVGMNWSGQLGNPIEQNRFKLDNSDGCYGFAAALVSKRINIRRDPVCLVVHLTRPSFNFLDRGKGSVAL